MGSQAWNKELTRLALFIALFAFAGYLFQATFNFVVIAIILYGLRNFYHLRRLYCWVHGDISFLPPKIPGLWGDVFEQFGRLQRRNRKRKRKLKKVIDRFRLSASSMADAAVIIEPSGEIRWFNRTASQIFGIESGKKYRHRSITDYINHPEFNHFLSKRDNTDVLEIPSPVKPDHYLSIDIVPYGKKQKLMLAKDITRIRRLEQTRQDFVANVSHELKTPLTVINGYVETLEDFIAPEDDMTHRIVGRMSEQCTRMQRLVDELLLLSRLETGEIPNERNVVKVPDLIDRLYNEAFSLSGGKHLITKECDAKLFLRGHESELHSAFNNLITNAIRYTPEEGEIHIRWYIDDEGAHFEVKDSGEGIDEQHIPRLTERFYRVDVGRSRSSGGTGLGLAIVKHVLLRYDAKLHIESQLKKGSLFRCDFPKSAIERKYLVDKFAN